MSIILDGTSGITTPAVDTTTAITAADGGTGQTSLTAGSVLVGNGTSAVNLVAAGSSGNVLTSNGTTWTSAAASSGVYQAQIFTAPGTWTKPASATSVKVLVIGGGGGGSSPNQIGGMGGLATAYVSGITGPVSVTVGAGGNVSSSGGASSFGSYVSATGGGLSNSHGSGTVTTGTTFTTSSVASYANIVTQTVNTSGIQMNVAGLTSGYTVRNVFGNSPAIAYVAGGTYIAGAAGGAQNTQPAPLCGGVGGVVIVEFVG